MVVKLENRLDINIIGVFKALLIRHYNCLLTDPRLDLAVEVKKSETLQLSSIKTCGFSHEEKEDHTIVL